MKCFKYCVSTDESQSHKSTALDAFEEAESQTSKGIREDKRENEIPGVAGKNSLGNNENFWDTSVWTRNCEEEVTEPLAGTITGSIPKWLTGTLLRNGVGSQKVGEYSYQHLFDGFAMVHRFQIENGQVTYQRRFVQSDTYKKNKAAQRIVVSEFGTKAVPDPCQSIFNRIFSVFHPGEPTDNTLVSVYPFGDEYYTLTETPIMNRIDPTTLQTMNKVKLTDYINIVHHTAHPHVMGDGTVFNLGTSPTQQGFKYSIVCFRPRRAFSDVRGNRKELSMFDQATIVANIPCRWKFNPSYMHSFGITNNYFIVIEQPLTLSVSKMLISRLKNDSAMSFLKWKENKNTLIHVISRITGRRLKTFVADTFFFFHIINQFETRDKQYIVLDVCCYRDSKIINFLHYESFKNISKSVPDCRKLIQSKPLRFVLPMKLVHVDTPPDQNLITIETVHQSLLEEQLVHNVDKQPADCIAKETNGEVVTDRNDELGGALRKKPTAYRLPDGNILVKPELLSDLYCELPRINDGSRLGKEYRYFYSVFGLMFEDEPVGLVKVDTFRKTVKKWQEANTVASEPIFVADPSGKNEDDGVVLSSILWTEGYENRVALLILDAATFKEIARVTFDTPGPVPKCLHGWFAMDKQA